MGRQLHVVDLRHIGDAPAFKQPAHLLEIRGKNIDGLALQQFAKVVPLVMVFAGSDGRVDGVGL